jgi:hypothetical protein
VAFLFGLYFHWLMVGENDENESRSRIGHNFGSK